MAKRERKGRTWEGVVWEDGYKLWGCKTGTTAHVWPQWMAEANVRITEIVPKSKKAAKGKGRK